MGGEELKWCQLAHHQLMNQPRTSFIKAQISGRMVSSGISDVAFVTVHSKKTRLKKLIMIIIIMKKSQEMTIFSGRQKLTSAMKLRPEK